MALQRSHEQADDVKPGRKFSAAPVSSAASLGVGSPPQVVALQGSAGNRAVARLIGSSPMHRQGLQRKGPQAPAPANPMAQPAPFALGPVRIATYGEAASALRLWCLELESQTRALSDEGATAPASLEGTRKRGV